MTPPSTTLTSRTATLPDRTLAGAPAGAASDAMALVSRALMAVLYVPYGWEKVMDFQGTVQYIASAHFPLPAVAAVIGIVAELVLPIVLLVGWQARRTALALAVYTLVLPFVFHHYWAVPAAQMYDLRLTFYRDLAIAGGLFALAAHGAGRFSLDARQGRA
jgi:putative oxidoreductase